MLKMMTSIKANVTRLLNTLIYHSAYTLLVLIINILACIPLKIMRLMGAYLLLLIYYLPIKLNFFKKSKHNIQIASKALDFKQDKLNLANYAKQFGALIAELPSIFKHKAFKKFKQFSGLQALEASILKHYADNSSTKGMLFFSPHWGSFELFPQLVNFVLKKHYPNKHFFAMYKPSKFNFLTDYIKKVNAKQGIYLVPANLSGLKQLLKALKDGHVVGILPDQVPKAPNGLWVNFLGHSAYTSDLIYLLAQKTQAATICCGIEYQPTTLQYPYRVHIEPFNTSLENKEAYVQAMNDAMQRIITKQAYLYLWGYNRFKSG